ncbi:uncharacterized protein LOC112198562 isoform X2 [Rosa chinensis]|uniref:uncharacterized protein LOC112198562 isoform X2 n=1 Tax=Rosa chinensis TaxID=74649 RepID=UPI001AD8FA66|nr:uncharacterized protein LOC112198562 isoform X2 [Rosa chinensis]
MSVCGCSSWHCVLVMLVAFRHSSWLLIISFAVQRSTFFGSSYGFTGTWKEALEWACYFAFASMFDILSTQTSNHWGENSRVVRAISAGP